jgi:hypothetical protein
MKLSSKNLELLEKCLKHWFDNYIAILFGVMCEVRYDSDDCAFCGKYFDKECRGCPIFKVTGVFGCKGTPYKAFCDGMNYGGREERLLTLVEAELLFLDSLRNVK